MLRKTLVLTQEDKGIEDNLPLINTLRKPDNKIISEGGPPSFYDDDQNKWQKKF